MWPFGFPQMVSRVRRDAAVDVDVDVAVAVAAAAYNEEDAVLHIVVV
jgi:hypothetical protein